MADEENTNLTECLDCGAAVSRNAAACPHCGAPPNRFEPASEETELDSTLLTEQSTQKDTSQPNKYSLPCVEKDSILNKKTIDLVKVNKRKGIFYPVISIINIIGYGIGAILSLIAIGLVGAQTDSILFALLAGIIVWYVWAFFCTEPLIFFAENHVYDVDIVFEDGSIIRQSDGSKSTRALGWDEFFFRAVTRYGQQRELSETEIKIAAQSFLTLSEIKSRKVTFD